MAKQDGTIETVKMLILGETRLVDGVWKNGLLHLDIHPDDCTKQQIERASPLFEGVKHG